MQRRGGGENAATSSAKTSAPVSGSATELQQQYEQVVDAVLPSVVKIQTDQAEGPASCTTGRATS